MTDNNTSHLAGEFLVAGELSRRGYAVSITFGNAKSVDIYATAGKSTICIDAKAGRGKSNWPVLKSSVKEEMYYIFVYLQRQNKIIDNEPPEYFITSGNKFLTKDLIKTWGTRQGVTYSSLNNEEYKERWDKLPPP